MTEKLKTAHFQVTISLRESEVISFSISCPVISFSVLADNHTITTISSFYSPLSTLLYAYPNVLSEIYRKVRDTMAEELTKRLPFLLRNTWSTERQPRFLLYPDADNINGVVITKTPKIRQCPVPPPIVRNPDGSISLRHAFEVGAISFGFSLSLLDAPEEFTLPKEKDLITCLKEWTEQLLERYLREVTWEAVVYHSPPAEWRRLPSDEKFFSVTAEVNKGEYKVDYNYSVSYKYIRVVLKHPLRLDVIKHSDGVNLIGNLLAYLNFIPDELVDSYVGMSLSEARVALTKLYTRISGGIVRCLGEDLPVSVTVVTEKE